MATRLIRSDEAGLFIKVGPERYRPGGVNGLDHVHRMDAADVEPGQHLKATQRLAGGLPVLRIITAAGITVLWSTEYVLKMHPSCRKAQQ